jgi:hypothetical protein
MGRSPIYARSLHSKPTERSQGGILMIPAVGCSAMTKSPKMYKRPQDPADRETADARWRNPGGWFAQSQLPKTSEKSYSAYDSSKICSTSG